MTQSELFSSYHRPELLLLQRYRVRESAAFSMNFSSLHLCNRCAATALAPVAALHAGEDIVEDSG